MPDLHLMWVELFRSEYLRKFLVTLTISHIAFEMRQRTSQIISSWRLFVQSLGLLSTAQQQQQQPKKEKEIVNGIIIQKLKCAKSLWTTTTWVNKLTNFNKLLWSTFLADTHGNS